MSSASVEAEEEAGHFVGLGVVLDNPSLYDYTALQPIIIIHYFVSPIFIFIGKFTYKELQQLNMTEEKEDFSLRHDSR